MLWREMERPRAVVTAPPTPSPRASPTPSARVPQIAGATGSYQAHMVACPAVDWPALAKKFVESLGLQWNPYVTQIEPHDFVAELFHACGRYNTVQMQ